MTDSANMVIIRDIHKAFRNSPVLRGVSSAIPQGEVFCLLGSNGAGKTTLVNILATLLAADRGTAQIGGFDVKKQAAEVRRIISLTGQYAALDGFLTGRENLELIARLRHAAQPQRIAQQMLARFGLCAAADRQAATYSGGMRRRLDIAMSLIGDPQLLFLDEPTTGLDPQSRLAMWETIRGLAENGVTVFLTTQYIEEAEQLADHIAVLDGGLIVAEGTAEALLAAHPGAKNLQEVFLAIVASGANSASDDTKEAS